MTCQQICCAGVSPTQFDVMSALYAGDSVAVETIMRKSGEVPTLVARADQAMRTRDHRAAVELLEHYVMTAEASGETWLRLAVARRSVGDLLGALGAVQEALRINPSDFTTLLMAGSLMHTIGQRENAVQAYTRALAAAPTRQDLPSHLRDELSRASAAVDADRRWRDRVRNWQPRTTLRPQTKDNIEVFRSAILDRQDGIAIPYPGLSDIGFFDLSCMQELSALEQATAAILAEFQILLAAKRAACEPITHHGVATSDSGAGRWSGLHLFSNGNLIEENARFCPETIRRYLALSPPVVSGRSPSLMFSILDPHTRIPPHRGFSNTRLVLHLPLIIPDKCGIRVGTERRRWHLGQAMLFNDTLEHEVWNDSDTTRVILLGDVWRPELSYDERDAVAALAARPD